METSFEIYQRLKKKDPLAAVASKCRRQRASHHSRFAVTDSGEALDGNWKKAVGDEMPATGADLSKKKPEHSQ